MFIFQRCISDSPGRLYCNIKDHLSVNYKLLLTPENEFNSFLTGQGMQPQIL